MTYRNDVQPFKGIYPSNIVPSYNPTTSSLSSDASDRYHRPHQVVIPKNAHQETIFRAIEDIHPAYLKPWGYLPNEWDPQTKRCTWLRRTPENVDPVVWCRKTKTMCDVTFEVTFSDGFHLSAHVPLDSWNHKTCDPEAVRAALQQGYFNDIRKVKEVVVVRPGARSSRVGTSTRSSGTPRSRENSHSSGSAMFYGEPHPDPRTPVWQGQSRYADHAYPTSAVPQYAYAPRQSSQHPPLTYDSSHTLVAQDHVTSYSSSTASTLVDTWDQRQRHYHVPPPQVSERHMSVLSYSYGSGSSVGSDSVRTDRQAPPPPMAASKKRKGWWHW